MYLETLKFNICFENCAKSKKEEQKRTEGVLFIILYETNL